MTAIKAILVDLDGTLADTAAANYAAYAAALLEHGVSVDQDDFNATAFGRNWRQFLPEILDAASADVEPIAIAARKAELYVTMLDDIGINRALVRLLEFNRGSWRTALVTSASATNAHAILEHHNLSSLFDTVVTGSDVSRHKPDPEAYHVAAERLGVKATDCIIFEDSEIGMEAARAFGVEAIQVVMARSMTHPPIVSFVNAKLTPPV